MLLWKALTWSHTSPVYIALFRLVLLLSGDLCYCVGVFSPQKPWSLSHIQSLGKFRYENSPSETARTEHTFIHDNIIYHLLINAFILYNIGRNYSSTTMGLISGLALDCVSQWSSAYNLVWNIIQAHHTGHISFSSSKSIMTKIWVIWSSTSCKQETSLPGTTTATQILLLRSTYFQGEGE